jgi:hypothetical protein
VTLVSRDPVWRTELHRREIRLGVGNKAAVCARCGGRNARGNLFQYWLQCGGIRYFDHSLYCSVKCAKGADHESV